MIYPGRVWYSHHTVEVLQRHVIRIERVERLMLQPTDKLPEDLER